MPILIHLNGPSGVGKSTLAQRYVDEHPGVLNLDIDAVVSLIGGWRDDFFVILLLDPDSRLLLFEGRDLPDSSDTARWWFTAGGGMEHGETLIEAAEREVREETGHTGLKLVGPSIDASSTS